MKKLLVLFFGLCLAGTGFSQDLPTNPEPGKCYVRCVTPDVWRNETVTITTSPAYKKLRVVPAKYETVTESVVTADPSARLVPVAAKMRTEKIEVVTSEASKRLVLVPGTTRTETEEVVVQAASQRLEIVPAVYENQTFEVVVQPASEKVEIVPAKYETQEYEVVVKEASQRIEIIPAEYRNETITYQKKETGSTLKVIPASLTRDSEVVETRPATAKWEMGDVAPDCASSDPNDCRTWCYKNVPAQFETVATMVLANNASTNKIEGDCGPGTSNPDCLGTYTKKVLVKPASTRVIDIPAVTKMVKKTVMVTPPTTKVTTIPAVTKTMTRKVMVTPPTTRVIEIPAVTKTVKKTIIVPATTEERVIPEKTTTMDKIVMAKPPTATEVPISGKSGTIKMTKLVSDAQVIEEEIPAKTTTVTKEILDKKGGLTVWREIECKLVEYSPLPINWNLGSATLTSGAKKIIDERLLPLIKQNEGASVEIASHTDSRGGKAANQALSERRAQAVVNYLIAKGINNSRLVANGYGENKLLNRCSDGVSCTEREHADNRRTEFRFISQ
ncbi:OmpA family protein [Spongiivirga sp. MCCC 1A20706]|uniref:OmpA family protein n=1 Tax=Spongiivirga sp. MCCC 1A20706 TaxID=3160963 RepID=UPI00397756F2